MATLGDDNVVRVWNAPGGELLHELEGHTSGTYVVFGPDGRIMVTLGEDNVVRIWDAPGGQLLHELEGHEVVFSPDGRFLTTISHEERNVRLWDLASGQLLHLLTLPHPPPGSSWWFVGFSPDWRELAVVSGGSVLFFDMASGALQHTLEGYCLRRLLEGSCFASDLAFSLESNALITVGGFEVRTWDVPSGQLRQTQTSDMPVGSIAISPDGQRMAWGGGEQEYYLQMWDAVSGQLLYTIEDEAEPIDEVAFSPDGQLLATHSGLWQDPMVHLRQASTGELLFSREASRFAFSPDGRLFATPLHTNDLAKAAVEVWDTATFQRVRRFEGLSLLAFSPDGSILAQRAVENDDGSWHITAGWWDIDSGELLRSFVEMDLPSSVMAFSSDNRLLLGSDYYGYLTIWDGNSSNLLWGDGHGLTGAFSPNGRFLATVSGAGIVRLWGLPSDKP
jgi:WD40 repeat protein